MLEENIISPLIPSMADKPTTRAKKEKLPQIIIKANSKQSKVSYIRLL